MNKNSKNKASRLEREQRLIEQLRKHPQLLERLETIVGISAAEGEKLQTADEVEERLVEEIRRLGNEVMGQWAEHAEARVGQELVHRQPGVGVKKKKELTWWCVFGQIRVQERIWRAPGQSYLRVFAAQIGVSAHGKSRRLQRVLTDFGAEHSFRASGQRLKEHYGFELNASAVRTVTLQHAQRAQESLASGYEESFRLLPKTGPAFVVAQVDGTMISTVPAGGARGASRPRQWQEMRLAAAQALGETRATYAASFGSVAEIGRRWGHCTREAGWALESRIHVVGDGAEWIRLQSQEIFGPQGDLLIDFYHVSEYLAAAAERCRPHAPEAWRRTQQQRLKRGAIPKILLALEPFVEPQTVDDTDAPVRAAIRYLSHRLDYLDYPHAIALGLPIGSGLIESAHKHVLQARLKLAGSAWLHTNAAAMAQLRVLRANQHWDSFWPTQQAA